MNRPSNEWDRLLSAARKAPKGDEAAAPFGFSTRVAARAFARPDADTPAVFARVSLRALLCALLVTAATVATNLQPVLSTVEEEVAALSEPLDFEDLSL